MGGGTLVVRCSPRVIFRVIFSIRHKNSGMTNKTDIFSALRVRPAVLPGVLIYLAYMAVFYMVFILVDIDYAHIGASAATLRAWLIPPTAAGFVVAVVLLSLCGWWTPALVEKRK